MTNQLQCSKKLLNRIDSINAQHGTNYELMMDVFEYKPENGLPEVKSGSVSIGKYTLWKYKKLARRRNRVFGYSFGKFYFAVHIGKSTYHVHMPKIHCKPCVQAKYYIKGLENEGQFSRKEMTMFLDNLQVRSKWYGCK